VSAPATATETVEAAPQPKTPRTPEFNIAAVTTPKAGPVPVTIAQALPLRRPAPSKAKPPIEVKKPATRPTGPTVSDPPALKTAKPAPAKTKGFEIPGLAEGKTESRRARPEFGRASLFSGFGGGRTGGGPQGKYTFVIAAPQAARTDEMRPNHKPGLRGGR
jgi:hypothetical protein